jgi:tetratricopeptide (TPR) repeat protein
MHELLRQFVTAQGYCTAEVSASHSAYYLALLQGQEHALRGHGMDQALATVRSNLDNIRLAWVWAVEAGQLDGVVASVGALRLACVVLGLWHEGATLCEQAIATLTAQPSTAAPSDRTLIALITMLTEVAELYDLSAAHGSLAQVATHLTRLGRMYGLLRARAAGHLAWGRLYVAQGRLARARHSLRLALQLAEAGGATNLEAHALYALGNLANFQGERASAFRHLEGALARYRQLGLRLEEANTLSALSHVYYQDPAKVYQFTIQRLALARRAGSAVDELRALHRLTILWLNVGWPMPCTGADRCCWPAGS